MLQFTYFQQAGGHPLAHPSVEITYGLERIIMALQVTQRLSLSGPPVICILTAAMFDMKRASLAAQQGRGFEGLIIRSR